jgi:putative membrane protein
MVMDMSAQDRDRISAAVRRAEAATSGEIVCVLARRSAETSALALLVSALAALVLPWILVALTDLPVLEILGLQLALFVCLAVLLSLPRLSIGLLPPSARRAAAHRAAMEQFMLRDMDRTDGRTGVLIFVSLAERYARIVADDAIVAKVPQSEWQGAIDALVGHMRDGRIADGYVEAIDRCGRVLAAHFPRGAADRNELPNRLYLI